MKSVGVILKSARESKNITIESLSKLTKIDPSYIVAIENDDYQNLPSPVFIKGFIRNLAIALDKPHDELVAIFRRDYQHSRKPQSLPKTNHQKINLKQVSSSQIGLFIVAAVVFLSYLAFQYRAVITPPKLEIISPMESAVTISPVSLEGYTSPGSVIQINKDLKIAPDSQGRFLAKLNLSPGQTTITFTATSRFGVKSTKEVAITVLEP